MWLPIRQYERQFQDMNLMTFARLRRYSWRSSSWTKIVDFLAPREYT
jgi:hypothetical protein